MELILKAVWAVLPGIIVGVVMAAWNRQQKKRIEREETKENNRVELEMIRLDLLSATAQLSYAVAMAYRRGTPNGEMETAIIQYEKAMDKFRRYERKQLAMRNMDTE